VELSVVIPVFNEVENIEPLIVEIGETLEGRIEYEIVVVDDGSTDGTADLLARLTGHYPKLRIVAHAARFGQSTALCSGVREAKGEWIATLDGDGQNDPADIPKLLEVAKQCAEASPVGLVGGHRTERQDHWSKRLASRLANAIRQRLLRDETPDTGCGLKLFRRAAFLELPRFDHMHRFLPALFRRGGGTVRSVPVTHRPRRHGMSKYGVWDRAWVGLFDLVGVVWLLNRPCSPDRPPLEKRVERQETSRKEDS
jgi:dolichol-phosphate mannosyltransferase